jgi:hypothetical protein
MDFAQTIRVCRSRLLLKVFSGLILARFGLEVRLL